MATVIVTMARLGALGALVFHPSHFAHFCCRAAIDATAVAVIHSSSRSYEPPTTTVAYVAIPPPKPVRMVGENYSFVLPAGFARDEGATGYVYRDGNRHHAVRIRVESAAGSSQEWIEQQFPSASETWTRTLGKSPATCARHVGKKLRIVVAAIVDAGVVYELACSSDEIDSPSADAMCEGVLASFRVGE